MSKNIILKKFDGPLEFLEWASNSPPLWKGELSSREVSESRTEWTGTENYDEAYKLAKYGWPEGLKMLTEQVEIAQQFVQPITIHRRRYDVAGHYPSPARAAAGEMFNMLNRGKASRPKPIVNIRHNFSFLGDQSAETIMRWGAALCSYIDKLQNRGYQVQLEATYESEPIDNTHESAAPKGICHQFTLKNAGDHLSLSSLVFWWAHPSAFRRIVFSARERMDIERWFGGGYGHPADLMPIEPGLLQLSIRDAGSSIEENLKIIHKKHLAVIAANPLQDFSAAVDLGRTAPRL